MCIIFLNCGKIKGKKALIYFAPATKSKKFSKKYWAEKRDCKKSNNNAFFFRRRWARRARMRCSPKCLLCT
jgi:hypothetical protein